MAISVRQTTKSGLVWLGDPSATSPILPPISIGRVPLPIVWRTLTALVLALGLLSVPVNCAMAAGPHSIFVDPASGFRIVLHVHNSVAPGAQAPINNADGERTGQSRLSNLPVPVTAMSVLVAVSALGEAPQIPVGFEPLPISQAVPSPLAGAPSVPPPRFS